MRAPELARERFEPLDRGAVIGELPGCAQPGLDGRAVAFGKVLEDIAFLVAVMPMSA
jgi:hypothetical protein